MKKTLLFVLAIVALVSCTKKTTNNTYYVIPHQTYTVNGIHDLTIVNGSPYGASMALSIDYYDSTQEKVTLAVSGLPNGIVMDNSWVSVGIPTFGTVLSLYDTTTGVNPGSYPVTITATSATFGTKTFTFNLVVTSPTLCTGSLTTGYSNCFSCQTSHYVDNVTDDPNIADKVWLNNFQGLGIRLYAWYDCGSGDLTFPVQSVSGTSFYGTAHYSSGSGVTGNIYYASTVCSFGMH